MPLSSFVKQQQAVFTNFLHFFDATCQLQPFKAYRYIHTEATFPLFNGIFQTPMTLDDIDDALRSFRVRFQDKPQFCWWVTSLDPVTPLQAKLNANGFSLSSTFSGMVYTLQRTVHYPRAIDGIHVEKLTDKTQLDNWRVPFQAAFSLDDLTTAFCIETFKKRWHDKRFTHFGAFHAGQMVGCATLFLENQIGGLYNLGVLPAYRHQSIGTALKYHRLKTCQTAGATYAVLQSSDMGRTLDERLGFQPVMDFSCFTSGLMSVCDEAPP